MRASLAIVVDSPPGMHQAVAGVELGLPAYGDRARAQGLQDAQVLPHVALEGEDADGGSGHGRRLVDVAESRCHECPAGLRSRHCVRSLLAPSWQPS